VSLQALPFLFLEPSDTEQDKGTRAFLNCDVAHGKSTVSATEAMYYGVASKDRARLGMCVRPLSKTTSATGQEAPSRLCSADKQRLLIHPQGFFSDDL
jgi:hypothetical protein